MYVAYFVNVETGELKRTATPRDNPLEGVDGWKRINKDEFCLFERVGGWMVDEFQKSFTVFSTSHKGRA